MQIKSYSVVAGFCDFVNFSIQSTKRVAKGFYVTRDSPQISSVMRDGAQISRVMRD